MTTVSVHYWAGARAAAGGDSDSIDAATVAEALDRVRELHANPHFDRVLAISSILVDGVSCPVGDRHQPLTVPVRVEVLPPFAGGA